MGFGIKLEVWGDYAAFNRPEMKVERVSYDVMTPSAARGILEAIYWKPEMRWVIDQIHVLSPIRFTQIRRNEISSKVPAGTVASAMQRGKGNLGISVEAHRQQRAALVLADVRYGIKAHMELTGKGQEGLSHPEAKHFEIFKRRAKKGQYFHHPYLGCREFPANFRLVENGEDFPAAPVELEGKRDLGFMLWDMVFERDRGGSILESSQGQRVSAAPRFFRAVLENGVLNVPGIQETRG